MTDMKTIVGAVQDINKKIVDVNKMFVEYTKNPREEEEDSGMSVADLWGDQRMNPYYLQVARYFDIDQSEYSRSQTKVERILRWAEAKAKSKDIKDILRVIDRTSKMLPSPGYGEKRYNIFYRYLRMKDMGVK